MDARQICGRLLCTIGVLTCLLLPVACRFSAPEPSIQMAHSEQAQEEHETGPHGGRMLRQAEFAVELRIEESGRPPYWQVYAYFQNQPVAAADYTLELTTQRLDGERERFSFQAEGAYNAGTSVVAEPHSFDVTIDIEHQGQRYHWQFPSYEGRSQIAAEMAQQLGIAVEPAGSQRIAQYVDVLGRVDFAPGALATLRAQFPGRVLAVMKTEGELVHKGDVLARIEASESLRSYELRATIDGLVIQRGTNVGDVVDQAALFVLGDPTQLRVAFHVYPGDYSRVRPGQTVLIKSVDGAWHAESTIGAYLPTTETATQTLIAYAALANDGTSWLPGMIVTGKVMVRDVAVAVAVRTQAIQRFRDFSVVFAQIGETYEVRMLELGQHNEDWTEVLGGIKPGQSYVTENSFLIKADIEKEGASHDH